MRKCVDIRKLSVEIICLCGNVLPVLLQFSLPPVWKMSQVWDFSSFDGFPEDFYSVKSSKFLNIVVNFNNLKY